MYDNYNYPMGADNEDAPWNEKENKPITRKCEVIVTLSKEHVPVDTKNYTEEEPEYPDFMGDIDTSDVNWAEEYQDQYFPIPSLLDRMSTLLREWAPKNLTRSQRHDLDMLLSEAKGWTQEDIEVELE